MRLQLLLNLLKLKATTSSRPRQKQLLQALNSPAIEVGITKVIEDETAKTSLYAQRVTV